MAAQLKLIYTAKETEYYASLVPDTHGLYVVPAFAGLGAPYWDMYARGAIVGLTRGATREHIIRATLEAIAYRTKDVISAMEKDSGIMLKELKVDGGAAANNFLMQFQADILNVPVHRPKILETTALGAAYLAGLAAGFWKDQNEIVNNRIIEKKFQNMMSKEERAAKYAGWQKAVKRAMQWEQEE